MIGGKKKLLNSRQYIHIVTAFQGYQYDSWIFMLIWNWLNSKLTNYDWHHVQLFMVANVHCVKRITFEQMKTFEWSSSTGQELVSKTL
jgi:hypothetical protein